MSETKNESYELDIEQYQFERACTGYGIEIYGATPKIRKSIVEEKFQEPLTIIDCSEIDTYDEYVNKCLSQLGSSEQTIEKAWSSAADIRRELNEKKGSFVLLEFDSLDLEVRKTVAQSMKGVAEGLDFDHIMIGFTSESGGEVVHANFDLSGRVQSAEAVDK